MNVQQARKHPTYLKFEKSCNSSTDDPPVSSSFAERMKRNSLLRHYQSIHAGFLHALGEKGTEYLLQKMNLNGTERVLEIGFGTGATLAKLKSRYPNLTLSGLDADPGMLEQCKRRLAFCRLKNAVELLTVSEKNRIPANSIDVVYLESVLGIMDDPTLHDSLCYIQKVLRPGGMLAFNESIWLESVSRSKIAAINQKCVQYFGIIQCNPCFSNLEKSVELIEKAGFKVVFAQRMNPASASKIYRKNYREYLSRLYSILGKFRLLVSFHLRKREQDFRSRMHEFFTKDQQYLSGAILIFKKN